MSNTNPRNENEPSAASKQPAPAVEIFATGWGTMLKRGPKIAIKSMPATAEPPLVVSLPTKLGERIKVEGYQFINGAPGSAQAAPLHAAPARPQHTAGGRQASGSSGGSPAGSGVSISGEALAKLTQKSTRLKPPGDVVKLSDRLYYLLQPPLESMLASESLEFPFKPFDYQFEGIAFLYTRTTAVLADEMGLGKTMQAIATVRLLIRTGEIGTVLLVCPKPLVSNWVREFKLWAPEIPVAVIEGHSARREWLWRLGDVPVKIANYELLLRDRELIESGDVSFDLMMLDEAQRIKNRSSNTSVIARAVPRRRSWALTGTPVENSVEDLVGIFEFLAPGYLRAEATPRKLAKQVSDHVLRRTKDMVLTDMPPKLYRDELLDLTGDQQASYQMAEEEGIVQLNELGDEIAVQHVFELVLRLKQICNFDPATGASSKLERLEADLEEVAASGKKAIVFSQWVKTLDQLKKRLGRFGTIEYHGKIPQKQREQVIAKFKEDPNITVILMSYGAGSVGLNLQFCEYVFLFDRWWNPAVEDQAINRAHRIGAAGPVTVTRMISRDTIEERIDQVLREKRELFEAILSAADQPKSAGLSREEIFGLFGLQPGKKKAA